ncbi:MAG: class I SAM-dependent methyltransferase [Betaproteobacteria bacterium]|nr:class I SAM-dependent methyltransferase [Betaproteobacteria bacterium]MSQ87921.1 class I SAM-dependent methyltransferase [Betaproteobacteria bacterium]
MTERACRICSNAEGNQSHFPKEMMFGWREEFEYLECARCGCLQIATIPADLAKYYPSDAYYSYKPPKKKRYPNWLLRLRHERTRYFLGEFSIAGAALGLMSKRSEHFDWFRRRVSLASRIVDIGCGAGGLLLRLQRDGFRSLLGADPFIQADIDYGNGLRILKRGVEELEGQYDFVMLHHSFEHMPDSAGMLQLLARKVAPGGTLLLRIPVSDCYARRKYGLHWIAWDAPRHLYLHTRKSMALLAANVGMEISDTVYDSSAQQFSGSELYIRGVPYAEHGKYRPGPGNRADAFSPQEWDGFQKQAAELNRKREGDYACFYLRAR